MKAIREGARAPALAQHDPGTGPGGIHQEHYEAPVFRDLGRETTLGQIQRLRAGIQQDGIIFRVVDEARTRGCSSNPTPGRSRCSSDAGWSAARAAALPAELFEVHEQDDPGPGLMGPSGGHWQRCAGRRSGDRSLGTWRCSIRPPGLQVQAASPRRLAFFVAVLYSVLIGRNVL